MGPTEEALSLADFLIAEFNLAVDRYVFAYAIMGWIEREDTKEPTNDPS